MVARRRAYGLAALSDGLARHTPFGTLLMEFGFQQRNDGLPGNTDPGFAASHPTFGLQQRHRWERPIPVAHLWINSFMRPLEWRPKRHHY